MSLTIVWITGAGFPLDVCLEGKFKQNAWMCAWKVCLNKILTLLKHQVELLFFFFLVIVSTSKSPQLYFLRMFSVFLVILHAAV